MASTSAIEWTDKTWNPVRGCARVSAGCEHCYAERVAYRFGQAPGSPYEGLTTLGKHGPRWVGRARFVPDMLGEPLKWRKPQRVFVNSMSDLFHEDITDEQIAQVFTVMAISGRHTFQILTKRPARVLRWFEWASESYALATVKPHKLWPLPNVWLGASCEDQDAARNRIPLLRRCPAAVHFVSLEPLLGPIDIERWLEWTPVGPDADGESHLLPPLRWVIVGGESGPGARPCDTNWMRSIVRQCAQAEVPCFVKQLGACLQTELTTVRFKTKGNLLEDMPNDLRVRQFPEVPA
jgi:protein gp37